MRDMIVDGVPLRDPEGEWGIDYTRSRMFGELSLVFDSDPPYGFHGNPANTPEEAYFTTSEEVWVLNVLADDKATFERNLASLTGLLQRPELFVLGAPQRSPLNTSARIGATFALSGDLIKQAKMRMLGNPGIERISETACRMTCTMENLNAFWMSSAYYTSAQVLMATPTQTLTLDATAADSSKPITDGLVRIKGPIAIGGSITVQDRANPFRALRYTATVALAATEYVVIDMATLTARLQVSDVWTMNTGTDVSPRVSTSGDGAFYLSGLMGASWPAGPWFYFATLVGVNADPAAGVEIRLRRSYPA